MNRILAVVLCSGWLAAVSAQEGDETGVLDNVADEPVATMEESSAPAVQESAEKNLTAEQLAHYNGKKGKECYVCVDGTIYNLTGVKAWAKGTHNGAKCGSDASARILKSPHGKKVLENKPVVGKLTASTADPSAH